MNRFKKLNHAKPVLPACHWLMMKLAKRRIGAGSKLLLVLFLLLSLISPLPPLAAFEDVPPVPIQITRSVVARGNSSWDWWQARTAYVPGASPVLVTTMSETGKVGTHDFHDIYQSISRDDGQTWSVPAAIPTLRRRADDKGYEVAPGDLWPKWHAASRRVIATGKTFNFAGGEREDHLREKVSYAVMDPATMTWSPLRTMQMPSRDHAGEQIVAPNAGCNQRFDPPGGEILLPVRYLRDPRRRIYTSIVVRCGFDGNTLTYQTHGSEHTIDRGRGLYEPSLTGFGGEYFLTLRADHSAFVTKGKDGIHFEPVKEWTFDDGKLLGSYNTQQHWVTVGGGLFLVYTRRGADNDHIMRHRAPLFIAQVDPHQLHVIRSTERVLLPENHATLGNSGVCWIDEHESWITCGEGRVHDGARRGENNRVLLARVKAANAPD